MSKLKFLNKYILQWFFIRLARNGKYQNEIFTQNGWSIIFWIKPLSGWDNNFVYLGNRKQLKLITKKV